MIVSSLVVVVHTSQSVSHHYEGGASQFVSNSPSKLSPSLQNGLPNHVLLGALHSVSETDPQHRRLVVERAVCGKGKQSVHADAWWIVQLNLIMIF